MTRYVFGTRDVGFVTRSPNRLSLVMSSRPEVLRSSRPTGERKVPTSAIRSYTVGRPPGSLYVVK